MAIFDSGELAVINCFATCGTTVGSLLDPERNEIFNCQVGELEGDALISRLSEWHRERLITLHAGEELVDHEFIDIWLSGDCRPGLEKLSVCLSPIGGKLWEKQCDVRWDRYFSTYFIDEKEALHRDKWTSEFVFRTTGYSEKYIINYILECCIDPPTIGIVWRETGAVLVPWITDRPIYYADFATLEFKPICTRSRTAESWWGDGANLNWPIQDGFN